MSNAENLFKEAEVFYKRGNYIEALELLQRANEEQPKQRSILYAMAQCYQKLGEYQSCINICEDLKRHWPGIEVEEMIAECAKVSAAGASYSSAEHILSGADPYAHLYDIEIEAKQENVLTAKTQTSVKLFRLAIGVIVCGIAVLLLVIYGHSKVILVFEQHIANGKELLQFERLTTTEFLMHHKEFMEAFRFSLIVLFILSTISGTFLSLLIYSWLLSSLMRIDLYEQIERWKEMFSLAFVSPTILLAVYIFYAYLYVFSDSIVAVEKYAAVIVFLIPASYGLLIREMRARLEVTLLRAVSCLLIYAVLFVAVFGVYTNVPTGVFRAAFNVGEIVQVMEEASEVLHGVRELAKINWEEDVYGSHWHIDITTAFEMARQENKRLVIYFHAPWCSYCTEMFREAWKDFFVAEELGSFIAVRINVDNEASVASRYGIDGIPAIVIANANGEPVTSAFGKLSADELRRLLTRWRR